LFVSIFGTTLVFFGIITFNFLSDSLQKDFDDALFNYSVDVSDSVVLNPSGDLSVGSANVDQEKVYPFSLGTALIQIRHISGTILSRMGKFGSFEIPYKSDFEKLKKGDEAAYRTISKLSGLPDAEAFSYRVISFPLDNSPTPQLVLQIAVPLTFVEAQIANRKRLFLIGIPLVILISALAGFLLTSQAMAPLDKMIESANEIGAGALSERLPVPPTKGEVRELSLTINEMLSRIEKAFLSQERFIADASHQLLTPLSIMKNELSQNPDNRSSLQEVDQMIALVKNLLLLARVDAGIGALNLEKIYFDEVILDAISQAEKLARGKNIGLKFDLRGPTTEIEQRPMILGDEGLLQSLVFNLIENAIKYSDENSAISLRLSWTEAEQVFEVSDTGPGIPADQIETIFERFRRGENSTRKTLGYGLGLAIARQIAVIHGATLTAHNENPGARFELRIKNI
jgi:signal transduction histidine kinase